MYSKEWLKGVARIANQSRTEQYPLCNNPEHFTEEDIIYVLNAHHALMDKFFYGERDEIISD